MHRNARLTPLGRRLLVDRVRRDGWPVARAAASLGVSRATAHKWLRRHAAEGDAGLADRSSRPRRSPGATPAHRERRILRARRRLRRGPHRLARALRCPRSTIYAVLRRHGVSRLRDCDRVSGVPVRYVRDRPGELVHLDVKKLGRIPDGGGHRMLGWERRHQTARRQGSEYLHVAVDDASRLAFARLLPDERGETCARFLLEAAASFADHGVRVERVLTDNARAYAAAHAFRAAVAALGARHHRTKPYRPQTNGKAERFIQTALAEWAYRRLYRSNDERAALLPRWLRAYNHHRPHTALGGRSPLAAVNNLRGNDT